MYIAVEQTHNRDGQLERHFDLVGLINHPPLPPPHRDGNTSPTLHLVPLSPLNVAYIA